MYIFNLIHIIPQVRTLSCSPPSFHPRIQDSTWSIVEGDRSSHFPGIKQIRPSLIRDYRWPKGVLAAGLDRQSVAPNGSNLAVDGLHFFLWMRWRASVWWGHSQLHHKNVYCLDLCWFWIPTFNPAHYNISIKSIKVQQNVDWESCQSNHRITATHKALIGYNNARVLTNCSIMAAPSAGHVPSSLWRHHTVVTDTLWRFIRFTCDTL